MGYNTLGVVISANVRSFPFQPPLFSPQTRYRNVSWCMFNISPGYYLHLFYANCSPSQLFVFHFLLWNYKVVCFTLSSSLCYSFHVSKWTLFGSLSVISFIITHYLLHLSVETNLSVTWNKRTYKYKIFVFFFNQLLMI